MADKNCSNETIPAGGGLTEDEHGVVNRPSDLWAGGDSEKFGMIDDLRVKYAGDVRALGQLDIYDPRSDYYTHLRLYRNAIHSGNQAKTQEEAEWFESFHTNHGLD